METRSWAPRATRNSPRPSCSSYVPSPLLPPLPAPSSPPHRTLQSQTQGGRRYQPHLTRFYAGLMPPLLLPLIQEALTAFGVKWKPAQEVLVEEPDGSAAPVLRMRVGGHDARRLMYKGWIRLERFKIGRYEGTYCVFARDQVSGLLCCYVMCAWWARVGLISVVRVCRATRSRGVCCGRTSSSTPRSSRTSSARGRTRKRRCRPRAVRSLTHSVEGLVWSAPVPVGSTTACTRYHIGS